MSSSCSSFAGFVLDDLDIRAVARASPRFVGLDPSSELILSDECARSIVDSLFSTDIDDFADDYDGGIVYESAATSNVEFVSLNSKE